MRRLPLVVVTLLTLSHTPCLAENTRTITVTGQATISAQPQFATIDGELKIIRPTLEESYGVITRTLVDFAKILQELGITKDKVIVSVIRQGAEYQWRNNSQTLTGYRSSCHIAITVDEISALYQVHARLATFSDLTIYNTTYGRHDKSEMKIAALQQALDRARSKAAAMASTYNATLGQVQNIRETGTGPTPVPMFKAQMAAAPPADPGDVSTIGDLSFSGNVTVQFVLND